MYVSCFRSLKSFLLCLSPLEERKRCVLKKGEIELLIDVLAVVVVAVKCTSS